jgi:hypothetical protein
MDGKIICQFLFADTTTRCTHQAILFYKNRLPGIRPSEAYIARCGKHELKALCYPQVDRATYVVWSIHES